MEGRVSASMLLLYMYVLVMMPSCIPAFTVYWNVPTQTCLKFGVHINVSVFGIVQNTNDLFYGDKVREAVLIHAEFTIQYIITNCTLEI